VLERALLNIKKRMQMLPLDVLRERREETEKRSLKKENERLYISTDLKGNYSSGKTKTSVFLVR